MIPLVGHALVGILYFFVLLSVAVGERYESRPATLIIGSLVVIAWCAGHVWLFIIAYRSILALRQECLAAKLKSKQS